jgi:hypothetical protein
MGGIVKPTVFDQIATGTLGGGTPLPVAAIIWPKDLVSAGALHPGHTRVCPGWPHQHKLYRGKLLPARVMADDVGETTLKPSLRGCFLLRFDVDGDDKENWQRTPVHTQPARKGAKKVEQCIFPVVGT